MNFAFIYMLGRYLKNEEQTNLILCLKKYPLWTYFISSAINHCMFIACYVYFGKHVSATKLWGNNNPFVLLSAISLFCFFSKIDFQSAWVNNVARCSFPVFLFHTNITIQPIRNILGYDVYASYGYLGLLVLSMSHVHCSPTL